MGKSNPVSVMTFVFAQALSEGKITLETLMSKVREIGVDGLEIFLSDLIADAATLRRYQSLLKANDLKLSCIDAICDFVSTDVAERRKAVEHLRIAIETAGEFGCTRVMHAGSTEKPGISPAEGQKMIADAVASQVDLARKAGVTMMLEDFGMSPNLICRAADCLKIMDLCHGGSQVKFTFDTGNFIFAGENPEKNLDILLPTIHHVHVKAWRKLADRKPGDTCEYAGYIGCPISQGEVPNEKLVRRILAAGYEGWFSIECGAVSDPIDAVKRDYALLKNWF
jgi:sugar phosphate isomerase/epimerase